MDLLTRLSRVTYRSATPELIGVKLKEFVALTYLARAPAPPSRSWRRR